MTSSAVTALSYSRIFGANERIRLGLIGAGDRGMQMWKLFMELPRVQAVAVSDVWDVSLRQGEQAATAKGGTVKTFGDYRKQTNCT